MKGLLLDQGLPRSSAALLREAGWDAIHVADIGMSRADDGEILRRALAEARVCVTLDADFHALLATSGEIGPSVIRIRKEGSTQLRLRRCCNASGAGSKTCLGTARWSLSRSARSVSGGCRSAGVETRYRNPGASGPDIDAVWA